MKLNRTILGIAFMVVAFITSCNQNPSAKKTEKANDKTEVKKEDAVKIAYVEIDSLMTQYQFCKDYSSILKKKTETIQSTLNNKALALQKDVADFQSKIEQGAYTREQAESVQATLQKKQLQLQKLEQSLGTEFTNEQEKYNNALRDSLQRFLKTYNKTYGYTFVLSKAGDNILLCDPRFDITNDVVKGLNKRYKPTKEIQKALKK